MLNFMALLYWPQGWKKGYRRIWEANLQCQEGLYFKNFMQQARALYNSSPLFVHSMHSSPLYFIVIVITKMIIQSSHLSWGIIKVILLGGALFVLAHFKVLCFTSNHFSFCLFPSILDDTHIIGPLSIVSFTYEHF